MPVSMRLREFIKSPRAIIILSTLYTIVQLALQATLINVGNKELRELPEGCVDSEDFRSRTMWENIILIPLHVLAWAMHFHATSRSLTDFLPFLTILFAVSFGSSLAQFMEAGTTLTCTNQAMANTEAGRLVLSAISFAYFVYYNLNVSVLPTRLYMASIPTFTFLTLGSVVLAVAPRHKSSTGFLWVWVACAIISGVLSTVLLLARRAILRNTIPMNLTPPYDLARQPSPLVTNIQLTKSLPSLPNDTDQVAPARRSLMVKEAPSASRSPSMFVSTGYSTTETSSTLTSKKRESVSTETRSGRTSVGAETFRTAPASRSSVDTMMTPLEEPQSPAVDVPIQRLSQGHQRVMSSYVQSTPPSEEEEEDLPSREHELRNPDSPANEHYDIPTHPNQRTDDTSPTSPMPPPDMPEDEPPSPVNASYPPSSFTFPTLPHPPPSRSPSASSSTPTVPPYSGPYSHRERRDTLASNRTYETLPSYHSRRSTQTLADMVVPPSPRNIRSLPPLPPLPPFISLASVLLTPTFSSDFPHTPNTPVSPASARSDGSQEPENRTNSEQ
ncbi:hypothetical protein V5O48_008419 [Marasmius crinis-equi]|uniref:Uncharacterized protein n=1 Tax=Marasmius crinis-equi TaxID=585013 RepID=A0ABR3FEK5_9AGAR